MTTTKTLISLFLFLISISFYAQDIVTDRPDQTESSATVEKSALQIESGFAFENYNNGKENNFVTPSTLLRYGISKIIELRFVAEYQSTNVGLDGANRKYQGFNDLEIGAKIQLLKKENIDTEIAFLSHFVIPTANANFTTNYLGIVNKLSISHSISEKLSVGYNIGYDLIEKQSALTYSLAIGFSISNSVGFYIEPYGVWAEQNQFESNFDLGITYLLNSNLQLDLSYGTGLNNKMEYLAAGFSWKIPNFLVKQ